MAFHATFRGMRLVWALCASVYAAQPLTEHEVVDSILSKYDTNMIVNPLVAQFTGLFSLKQRFHTLYDSTSEFTSPLHALAYLAAKDMCTPSTTGLHTSRSLDVFNHILANYPKVIFETTIGQRLSVVGVLAQCQLQIGSVVKIDKNILKNLFGNRLLQLPQLTLKLLNDNDLDALNYASKFKLSTYQLLSIRVYTPQCTLNPYITPALVIDQCFTNFEYCDPLAKLATKDTQYIAAVLLSKTQLTQESLPNALQIKNWADTEIMAKWAHLHLQEIQPVENIHPLDIVAKLLIKASFDKEKAIVQLANVLGFDGNGTAFDRALVLIPQDYKFTATSISSLVERNITQRLFFVHNETLAPSFLYNSLFNIANHYVSDMENNSDVAMLRNLCFSKNSADYLVYNFKYIYGAYKVLELAALFKQALMRLTDYESEGFSRYFADLAHYVGAHYASDDITSLDLDTYAFPCKCFANLNLAPDMLLPAFALFGQTRCIRQLPNIAAWDKTQLNLVKAQTNTAASIFTSVMKSTALINIYANILEHYNIPVKDRSDVISTGLSMLDEPLKISEEQLQSDSMLPDTTASLDEKANVFGAFVAPYYTALQQRLYKENDHIEQMYVWGITDVNRYMLVRPERNIKNFVASIINNVSDRPEVSIEWIDEMEKLFDGVESVQSDESLSFGEGTDEEDTHDSSEDADASGAAFVQSAAGPNLHVRARGDWQMVLLFALLFVAVVGVATVLGYMVHNQKRPPAEVERRTSVGSHAAAPAEPGSAPETTPNSSDSAINAVSEATPLSDTASKTV